MPSVYTPVMSAPMPPHPSEQTHVDREAERYRMTGEAMVDVDTKSGLSHQDVKAWATALSAGNPGTHPHRS